VGLRELAEAAAVKTHLLYGVAADVGSSLALSEILSESLALLKGVVPFSGGSIALINAANELQIHATYGPLDKEARKVRVPVGQGISGWVAAHGQPYLSNDLDTERHVRPVQRNAGSNQRIASYMAAPLIVEERVIGILQVNSDRKQAFTRRDLDLLTAVAARCAVAVDRARLFGEMETRARRLASLAEIARHISAALDLDELFATCYQQVGQVMAADAFFVVLYDQLGDQLRYEFVMDNGQQFPAREEPFGVGITSHVISTRQPLLVSRRADLPASPIQVGAPEKRAESLLVVPLVFEDQVLGAMSTQSYQLHAYNEADLNLLITIGNQAAVAIRNAQLYQSERTAQRAKDEFLSLVSHELRTPLTTIKGSAQVMQRRMVRAFSAGQVQTPEDRAAREQDLRQLAQIVNQSDRLTALVNDLLDVSRLQSGRFEFHPETADLAVVVRGVVEASRALSTTHRLLLHAPKTLPGMFDRLRIEQVLTNLMSNAVKYSPADTEIVVTLDMVEPQVARIAVQDQGPGLPPEEQAQLFERYFRGAAVRGNPRSGLGLGLFISRQIVELHGGEIHVDSRPGEGSTFAFTLPLDRPAGEA
jgi:signal transduction histidine kinase